jgi:uncharacterized membrane protein YgaE (UPF0421/DUF939 family)
MTVDVHSLVVFTDKLVHVLTNLEHVLVTSQVVVLPAIVKITDSFIHEVFRSVTETCGLVYTIST